MKQLKLLCSSTLNLCFIHHAVSLSLTQHRFFHTTEALSLYLTHADESVEKIFFSRNLLPRVVLTFLVLNSMVFITKTYLEIELNYVSRKIEDIKNSNYFWDNSIQEYTILAVWLTVDFQIFPGAVFARMSTSHAKKNLLFRDVETLSISDKVTSIP